MTLAAEAREYVKKIELKIAQQQAEFGGHVKAVLKARCYDVLMRRIEVDDISDEFVIELDEFRFTLIPADPLMQSTLAVLMPCSDCQTEVALPLKGMADLGLALEGQEAGKLYCEPCAMLHQESFDPPEGTTKAQTSLERFVEALQDVLVDYSLGGESMLNDLRKVLGARDAHPPA